MSDLDRALEWLGWQGENGDIIEVELDRLQYCLQRMESDRDQWQTCSQMTEERRIKQMDELVELREECTRLRAEIADLKTRELTDEMVDEVTKKAYACGKLARPPMTEALEFLFSTRSLQLSRAKIAWDIPKSLNIFRDYPSWRRGTDSCPQE